MLEVGLEEVVADILVLCDTVVVVLGLDDAVGDRLELELVVTDADGELVIA
jgi:hypothetical protein